MQIIKHSDQQKMPAAGGSGMNESGSSAPEPLSSEESATPRQRQTNGRTTSDHLDGNGRRTGPNDMDDLEEEET